MKETQYAQEKIRSEQMSTTKSVLENIKKDLLLCNQDVKLCVFGNWIHKSPSDQCKVILGLAVSTYGVALDNMSLSFLLCKLM